MCFDMTKKIIKHKLMIQHLNFCTSVCESFPSMYRREHVDTWVARSPHDIIT